MLPEKAESMLREYKSCVGRSGYLTKAVAEAEAEIEEWRGRLAEDLVGSSGANLDGMPHGTTVGHPTERMALILAMGYEPEDLKDAERHLQIMRRELRHLNMVIVFVEEWLRGLTEKESWLITRIYFDGCTYNETARAYEGMYGIQISRDGIRRMKKAVVKKIAEMAQ